MKTAIIYYSMSGNTAYVAEKIAQEINADLIRIEPVDAYPDKGFKKFFWGGKSAVMGDMPKLQPYEFDAARYERILIGTPVWAGTFTPPMKTFLVEHKELADKNIAAFMCLSGAGAEKALEKMKQLIGISAYEATLVLLDPKDKVKAENDEKIKQFCDMLK